MKTLTFIVLIACGVVIWEYMIRSFPLQEIPTEIFTAASVEEAQHHMQQFMEVGLVVLLVQRKHEVYVNRVLWQRIRKAKKEQFLVFAADYFNVTSLEPGRYVIVLDGRSKEILDHWRAPTPHI